MANYWGISIILFCPSGSDARVLGIVYYLFSNIGVCVLGAGTQLC